jgi:hypothetical protein
LPSIRDVLRLADAALAESPLGEVVELYALRDDAERALHDALENERCAVEGRIELCRAHARLSQRPAKRGPAFGSMRLYPAQSPFLPDLFPLRAGEAEMSDKAKGRQEARRLLRRAGVDAEGSRLIAGLARRPAWRS